MERFGEIYDAEEGFKTLGGIRPRGWWRDANRAAARRKPRWRNDACMR